MKRAKTSLFVVAVLGFLPLCGPASAASMVSYWRFDKGTGPTVYDSFGDNDGTIDGAEWTTGIIDGALSFDGVDDCVEVPDSSSLDITGDITVEAWVYPRSWPTGWHWPGIVCKGPGSYLEAYLLYFQSDGRFSAIVNSDQTPEGRTEILEAVSSSTNQWHHLAMVLEGTSFSSYRNGQLVDSITHEEGIKANDFVLHIGAMHNEPIPWYSTDYFDGLIDEVAIYDCALTPGEIEQHYENGLDGLGYQITVAIDIKPGNYPNALNSNGHGVIPVAILGGAHFDVAEIDVSTLSFAGLVVRVKGKGMPQCSVEDVSGDFTNGPEGVPDGYDDLVCHFVDDPATWTVGDGEATLTGQLLDGTPFEGTDSIKVVP